MDRLRSELQRLYLSPAGDDGHVRALVLELVQPAGWPELSRLWQGVQADLDLPAPAIAVSGTDAYQLWFSLAQPVSSERARAFLDALRARYLGDVAAERVRVQPDAALPPAEAGAERWSAFLAPDLAALFSDERWLDQPPGRDAQADLLSRVACTGADAFARVWAQLTAQPEPAREGAPAPSQPTTPSDPRAFLLAVMQDPAVELRLRIEAAKALLPWSQGGPAGS